MTPKATPTARIERFEDLEACKQARELARAIHAVTRRGAFSRDFSLKDHTRRAAVSVMGNIAEGFERGGNKVFLHFLGIAKGSCGELRSHLYAALDQEYVTEGEHRALHEQALAVSRIIAGLMGHLRRSGMRGSKYVTSAAQAPNAKL